MTTATKTQAQNQRRSGLSPAAKRGIGIGVVAALIVVMGLDTTFVSNTGDSAAVDAGFSPEAYGEKTFPEIKKTVTQRAAPAPKLAQALSDDEDAAIADYGVEGAVAPVLSVEATGTVESCDGGICTLDVADMPEGQVMRVQVGPAVNGTALRDGAGGIAFGDFKNQIEYQNAAAGINNAMKEAVLSDLDRDALPGQQLHVLGVFQRIIPNNWLITPVALETGA